MMKKIIAVGFLGMLVLALIAGTASAAATVTLEAAGEGGIVSYSERYRADSMTSVTAEKTKMNTDVIALVPIKFGIIVNTEVEGSEIETELTVGTIARGAVAERSFGKEQCAKSNNETTCYQASVDAKAMGSILYHEDAGIISESNLAFTAHDEGRGIIEYSAEESIIKSNITESNITALDIGRYTTNYRSKFGRFNATFTFVSEIPPEYPAGPTCKLCPFSRP